MFYSSNYKRLVGAVRPDKDARGKPSIDRWVVVFGSREVQLSESRCLGGVVTHLHRQRSCLLHTAAPSAEPNVPAENVRRTCAQNNNSAAGGVEQVQMQ